MRMVWIVMIFAQISFPWEKEWAKNVIKEKGEQIFVGVCFAWVTLFFGLLHLVFLSWNHILCGGFSPTHLKKNMLLRPSNWIMKPPRSGMKIPKKPLGQTTTDSDLGSNPWLLGFPTDRVNTIFNYPKDRKAPPMEGWIKTCYDAGLV